MRTRIEFSYVLRLYLLDVLIDELCSIVIGFVGILTSRVTIDASYDFEPFLDEPMGQSTYTTEQVDDGNPFHDVHNDFLDLSAGRLRRPRERYL
jgi:hypothetical protein